LAVILVAASYYIRSGSKRGDGHGRIMRHYERNKRALYWTAISLIICEGLPVDEAAQRMGVERDELIDILKRRRTVRLDTQSAAQRGKRPLLH
jgi:transposase